MKKSLFTMSALWITAAVLGGCGAQSKPSAVTQEAAKEAVQESTQAQALDKTTFTLGFDASFPPYGFMDEDGNYVGFDLDLAAEVCKRLDMELVLQPIDWDSKDMELTTGAIDCIWNGFTMQGREDEYTWSKPYVDNSQVFVVSEESGMQTQEDLAGKVVNVQADSSALAALSSEEHALLAASFAELIQVPEYNTAFMNLEAGAADAVAMDIGVAKYQIESRGGGFIILEKPLASEVYGIGFLKGNESLCDAVQAQLDAMLEDGTFDKIAEKWDLTDSVVLGK